MLRSTPLLLSMGLLFLNALQAQDGTVVGEFHVEHPTLENLGFEWSLSGDGNRNATVEVHYRKLGESTWREGLPLVRIGGEKCLPKKREPRLPSTRWICRFHFRAFARNRV